MGTNHFLQTVQYTKMQKKLHKKLPSQTDHSLDISSLERLMAFTLEAVSLLLELRHLVEVVVVTILNIASNLSFAKFQLGSAL